MTTREELQDELKACQEELTWLQAQPRQCATAIRLLTRELRRLRYRNEHWDLVVHAPDRMRGQYGGGARFADLPLGGGESEPAKSPGVDEAAVEGSSCMPCVSGAEQTAEGAVRLAMGGPSGATAPRHHLKELFEVSAPRLDVARDRVHRVLVHAREAHTPLLPGLHDMAKAHRLIIPDKHRDTLVVCDQRLQKLYEGKQALFRAGSFAATKVASGGRAAMRRAKSTKFELPSARRARLGGAAIEDTVGGSAAGESSERESVADARRRAAAGPEQADALLSDLERADDGAPPAAAAGGARRQPRPSFARAVSRSGSSTGCGRCARVGRAPASERARAVSRATGRGRALSSLGCVPLRAVCARAATRPGARGDRQGRRRGGGCAARCGGGEAGCGAATAARSSYLVYFTVSQGLVARHTLDVVCKDEAERYRVLGGLHYLVWAAKMADVEKVAQLVQPIVHESEQAALELTGSRKLRALVGALRGGDDKAIAATAHAFEAEFAEVVREHVGHLLATVAEVLVTTLCHEQPWKLVATESVSRRAEERLDGLFRTLLDDVMHNVALTSPPLADLCVALFHETQNEFPTLSWAMLLTS